MNPSHAHRRWGLITLALSLIAVLPFTLFGNSLWDGSMYRLAYSLGNTEWITQMGRYNGRPVAGWSMLAAYDWLGVSHGTVIVAALAVILSAVAVYGAGRIGGLLSPPEAAVLALFSTLTPAHQMMLSSSSLHFHLGFASYFLGLYFFQAAGTLQGVRRAGAEIAAVLGACGGAVMAESATLMLALYPLARSALYLSRRAAAPSSPLSVLTTSLRYSWPAVLGALSFVGYFLSYPAQAYYADERAVGTGLVPVIEGLARFGVVIFLCYLPVLVVVGVASACQRPGGDTVERSQPAGWARRDLLLLLLGLLALVLAIAPYLIADRKPTLTGWSVRFLLFTGIGLGLLALSWMASKRGGGAALHARMAGLLIAAVVLGQSWRLPLWAERQIKDDAVVAFIRAHEDIRRSPVVCLQDHQPVTGGPYRPFEWTAMFQYVSGQRGQVALQVGTLPESEGLSEKIEFMRAHTNLILQVPPARCTYDLLIPEPGARMPVMVAQGMFRRYLMSRPAYDAWLLSAHGIQGAPRP
ncbi:MAG: hypothetical protein Q7U62_06040 [Burkholderiaceae bacterium]|nr:hypothetical protein [Burkholderiaceae bacterium]